MTGPLYSYKLPCGSVFYSQTRSMPDDEPLKVWRRGRWLARVLRTEPIHWFPCVLCRTVHALHQFEIDGIEDVPRRIDGKRYGDAEAARKIDNLLKRRRVMRVLQACPGRPQAEIARECGVSVRTVATLAKLAR